MTRHLPDGEVMSIFDASEKYQAEGVPLLVLAGKEYGSGSSRDWAAKGPKLLGVRAVIAESYERIHRSNLVGMGILPLQFEAGESAETPRPDRRGGLHDRGPRRGPRPPASPPAGSLTVAAERADGTRDPVPGHRPDRHAAGGPLLPARRDPALRAPAVAEELRQTDGGSRLPTGGRQARSPGGSHSRVAITPSPPPTGCSARGSPGSSSSSTPRRRGRPGSRRRGSCRSGWSRRRARRSWGCRP